MATLSFLGFSKTNNHMKPLHTLTISEIHQGYQDKSFTCLELVTHLLDRIRKYDPKIHAFLYLNPDILAEASAVDQAIAESGITLPLQGIPIAVKDNFLTTDMPTTASSTVLKGYMPQYESTVTTRIRQAGALIIGKTNMDAWAHGSSTETSQFGPTFNPWDTSRLPGGSSGGSAAAVAAQFAPVALGTETAGSIRQPAAWCGVIGFKPSYGRVSRYGVIAMASSTDSPGPIARSMADCALVVQVISGKDTSDATSSDLPIDNYTRFTQSDSLQGKKIAFVREYLVDAMSKEIKELILKTKDHFVSLGAQVTEVSLMDPKYAIGVYTVVQRSEVSSNLARFDGVRFGQDRSYFGDEAKRRIMLGTYTLSAGYYDAYYKKAQSVRTQIIDEFAQIFSEYDAVIGATSPGPAQKIGASLDQPMFGEIEDMLVEPSSVAGLPGVSIPCGFVDGLPIGLQIICDRFQEAKVVEISSALINSGKLTISSPDLDSL
jgi:aspartyl-tRNA(Asn)/glutamyl-tRNA(Gln) amidotransferase subunit A